MQNEVTTHHLESSAEWSQWIDLAIERARTEPGKSKVADLEDVSTWAKDLREARELQSETAEALSLMTKDSLWGVLTDLTEFIDTLETLNRQGTLDVASLAQLKRWLYAADTWGKFPLEELQDSKGTNLKKLIQGMRDFRDPIRLLDRVLTNEGTLSESASPLLSKLFGESRNLKKRISEELGTLVKLYKNKGYLQEDFTDVRDGRYVVPIKSSHQNDVQGILYEASVSKQTVFIEPEVVSPLNNKLRQCQNEILAEIDRILKEVSDSLRPWTPDFEYAFEGIASWDAIYARAALAQDIHAKVIDVTEERAFELKECAHPLLWWSIDPAQIVKNSIFFGPQSRALLITGPNTGGKTVLLKTLGMAAQCARTGFAFPALGTPRVPFFSSIFSDLGDAQSIADSISSFSGHVLKFKDILENVTDQSLVLLDELNTATDPEEGAALGRAFLESLMARNAMIVATTHDPRLKLLATHLAQDGKIEVASMAFDEASRTPRFELQMGIPGRSRALETAERLGIPREVLELAQTYLSQEHRSFESLLSNLERTVAETSRLRHEAEQLKLENQKLNRELQEKIDHTFGDLFTSTRQKLKRTVELAQDEVRLAVKKLESARGHRDVDQIRNELSQTLQAGLKTVIDADDSIPLRTKSPASDSLHDQPERKLFEVGDLVKVPKFKSSGTILKIENDKYKVQLGIMQMNLSIDELERLPQTKKSASKSGQGFSPGAFDRDRPQAPPSKIDLRGKRLDDAMKELEIYLDHAFRCGELAQVTIVHGLGTGAIREGARALFKQLPYIKSFRDGGNTEGGAGATIVEF